jgi:hypothetical protein
MTRYFLYVLFLLGLFAQCAREPSKYSVEHATLLPFDDIEDSRFCLPIKISLDDLESRLNRDLKKNLLSNKKIDDKTRISIKRKGDIHLMGVKGLVETSVPLKVVIHRKQLIKLPAVSFELVLKTQTKLDIEPDWKLSSKSNLSSYTWQEEPTWNILGLEINFKDKVEAFLEDEKGNIAQSIDRLVEKKVDLKEVASNTWNNIQKRHNLIKGSGDTLSLHIKPTSIALMDHTIDSNNLTVNVQVDANLSIASNGVLETKEVVTELPDLETGADSCEGIMAFLISSITYQDLNKSLNRRLPETAEPIQVFGYVVDHAEISFKNGTNFIRVQVKGTSNGILKAQVKFGIDTIQERLAIQVSDIEVVSGDLQTALAVELLNLYVHDRLNTFHGFEYAQYLSQLPMIIEQAIVHGKSGDVWHPEFNTLDTKVEGLAVDSSGVRLKFHCTGEAMVVLDSIK